MPEGPSIVILKEAVQTFKGQTVMHTSGDTKSLETSILKGEVVIDFKTWGKHFLICFPEFTIRIHLMMFGAYRINDRKDIPARLSLGFENGELNFYTCSVILITQPLDLVYDWTADVMNEGWDENHALKKLNAQPDMLACDALLNQNIFSGVGNIIKNEVLFRIEVHPESRIGKLPSSKLKELVNEAVRYSYQFLEWKKAFTLKKHWLAHTKTSCPRDHVPLLKAHLGKTKRRSFYCIKCQKLYH